MVQVLIATADSILTKSERLALLFFRDITLRLQCVLLRQFGEKSADEGFHGTSALTAFQWAAAVSAGAAIAATVTTVMHSPNAQTSGVIHEGVISATQRGRIESLAMNSFQNVDVLDVGKGPEGMSWAILVKNGMRVVAWITPGDQSIMLGDPFVDGINHCPDVEIFFCGGRNAALPSSSSFWQTGAPADLQVMPIAAHAVAPTQNQSGLDSTGTNLLVAAAFMQVKDSFFSVPLYGNGSGGEILIFADPDCHFCHDLLQRMNAIAPGITKRGIRVRWYPVGVLRPQNGYSLQRAAAMLQFGSDGLLSGGVVSDTSGVNQESLRRVAMNTKALGEISPKQILTPTMLFRNHSGQSVVRLGAPTSDEEFVALINGVGK